MKHFLTSARWSFADKAMLAMWVIFMAWGALPSAAFLKPMALSATGNMMVFVRDVPWGPVAARWTAELIGPGGNECHASGKAYYQRGDGGGLVSIIYPLHEDLQPCKQTGEPFVLRHTHTVHLGGVLPLRSLVTVWDCARDDGTPCAKR
jgi:hypothetical protein